MGHLPPSGFASLGFIILSDAILNKIFIEFFGIPRVIAPGKNVPAGDKQRGNEWTNDETIDAINLHSAHRSDKNQVIRHFGIFADQNGAQNIIHQPYHHHEETDDEKALPQLLRRKR